MYGVECGLVLMNGKMIRKVYNKTGNESVLYKDILEHVKELSEEEKDKSMNVGLNKQNKLMYLD